LEEIEEKRIQSHIKRVYHLLEKENLRNPFPMKVANYGTTKAWQNFEPKGYLIIFFDEKGSALTQSMGVFSLRQSMRSLAKIYESVKE